MTCHHSPGDPECSSNRQTLLPEAPDSFDYEIEDVARFGSNWVLKVKYPNHYDCFYEGCKVMVFLGVTEKQVLMWKKIDPDFRKDLTTSITTAPSPDARFPASEEGWKDACEYAERKAKVVLGERGWTRDEMRTVHGPE